jgi:anti-sigma-K factor RskA
LTLPGWAIAIIAVAVVLFLAMAIFAFIMFRRERVGKPIFVNLKELPQVAKSST